MKTKSKTLFQFVLLFMFTISTSVLIAQGTEKKPSPAATATGKIGNANITIKYSSPSVKERKIWGALVPYGEVWRSGANEATTFETDRNIKVGGKKLPAGKYAFFTIPGEKEWIVIFNSEPNQWGAFKYKSDKDALRITVIPAKSTVMNERLVYNINNNGVVLSWENLDVPFSLTEDRN